MLLLLLFGCNSGAQQSSQYLSVDEFETSIAGNDVQLLDVRTAGEYRMGHIKGSLQANWNNEEEFTERTSALDKNKPVLLYCASGPRSHAAAAWLMENGFTNVGELQGGFVTWKRFGKPFEGLPDVPQMTVEAFNQQIAGKKYVLVDIGAEWCPPCKKMEPVIHAFTAANRDIFLLNVDGGVHTDVMNYLNADGLPTFILWKDGKEVWRYKGVISADELNKVWNEKK
ncbi:MAG: thioredoxin domain-containing protein [Lacibacter sp.]